MTIIKDFIQATYHQIGEETLVGRAFLQNLLVKKIDGFFRNKIAEKNQLLGQADLSLLNRSYAQLSRTALWVGRVLTDSVAGVILIALSILGAAVEISYEKSIKISNPKAFIIRQIKKAERNNNQTLKAAYVNILYVVEGLKPVYVHENRAVRLPELPDQIEGIKIIHNREDRYFINETPVADIDPRNFIDPQYFVNRDDQLFASLEEASIFAFPNQNQIKTDQLLSYLLGFGPSWESYYMGGVKQRRRLGAGEQAQSIFSDEHDRQLGVALLKIKEEASENPQVCIAEGKKYSQRCLTEPDFYQNVRTHMELNEDREQRFKQIYSEQVLDEVAFYTPYIQNILTQREALLIKHGIAFRPQVIGK